MVGFQIVKTCQVCPLHRVMTFALSEFEIMSNTEDVSECLKRMSEMKSTYVWSLISKSVFLSFVLKSLNFLPDGL